MPTETADWVGLTLDGRYAVAAKLGEGGMGFVYRARDARLSCDVVIKVPRAAMLEDAGFRRRFQDEVGALVRLAHPHVVKVSDFGLARAVDSTRLTREGQLLGTPYYLAPELIEGAEATPASDVYALGCLLYECVAGEPPFAARRLTELGFAHLAEPAPDARERRPELSVDFAAALLTALEKNPAARPTTATALARMLSSARTPGPA